eukprot:6275324-Prymnesium_polylepis.1
MPPGPRCFAPSELLRTRAIGPSACGACGAVPEPSAITIPSGAPSMAQDLRDPCAPPSAGDASSWGDLKSLSVRGPGGA